MAEPDRVRGRVRRRLRARGGRSVNYARRQQYRRLSHAGKAALGSVVAGLLGLAVASAGAAALGGLLLLAAVGLGLYARHWLSLARRSRVGARSEDEVQRALAPLEAEGWRLRHSLPWQGRGDIDSVAISPTGIAVAIETKTRTYDQRHLARVHDAGGVAVTTPAKMGTQRRAWRDVPRSCAGRRARRRGRPRRLDRPVDACPPRCRADVFRHNRGVVPLFASTAPLVGRPGIAATRREHCTSPTR